MPKLKDITNERYGRWLVKAYAGKDKSRNSLWLCLCDCGIEKIVLSVNLSNGTSTSCGCYKREKQIKDRKGFPRPLDGLSGANENHWRAKEWHFVKKSDGFVIKGWNLNQLVNDNRKFFTKKELAPFRFNERTCRATWNLSGLHRRKPNGEFRNDWKGWTIG